MGMHDRIKKIRSELFKSNIDFAETLGERPNTTSNWISGNRNIGLDVIEKIASKIPTINLNWLITGSGEMLKNAAPAHEISEDSKYSILVDHLLSQLEKMEIENKSLTKEVIRLELLLDQNGISYNDNAKKGVS